MAIVGRNEQCPCGSGQKHKHCCLKKNAGQPSVKRPYQSNNERLGDLYKTANLAFEKCLDPTLTCPEKAIRAHSIQNAQSLDLLVEDGHVISLRPEFKPSGPDVRFHRVGRNNASTFAGMCAAHDAETFKPLDTRPFSEADDEQLFLLAYRAVTRELHANMQGAVRLQSAYGNRVSRGYDSGNTPSVAGQVAVEQFVKSHEAWTYRAEHFDRRLAARDFKALEHDVITLDAQVPTIAVSSCFSVPYIQRDDGELVRCALNVLPVSSTTTKVVFSYIPEDAPQARYFFDRTLSSTGQEQRLALSRLIVRRVENFVIAPAYFAIWTEQKKNAVLRAFKSTIMNDADVPHDLELMLF